MMMMTGRRRRRRRRRRGKRRACEGIQGRDQRQKHIPADLNLFQQAECHGPRTASRRLGHRAHLWRTLLGVEGADAVSTISCTTAETTPPPLPVDASSAGAGGAEHASASSTEMASDSVWVSAPASDSSGFTLVRMVEATSIPTEPSPPALATSTSWTKGWWWMRRRRKGRKGRKKELRRGGDGDGWT
jgi:hypothetical protein